MRSIVVPLELTVRLVPGCEYDGLTNAEDQSKLFMFVVERPSLSYVTEVMRAPV